MTDDLSDAVRELFEVDMAPSLAARLPVPDNFRYRHAYTAAVDKVLSKYAPA